MVEWSIEKARETYNIKQWSEGYFDIGEQGQLLAYPKGRAAGHCIDLSELATTAQTSGLSLPILLRFPDILRTRVNTLKDAFANATESFDYHGPYTCVYPIKVNQQRRVVQALLQGNGGGVGLEAGSKPELMAVLALLADKANATIVCNGYKDKEYIRLALIAQKLGNKVYIILEKLSELDLVLQAAAAMQIEPNLGLRIRLSDVGSGKWGHTSGEKSKFGFSSAQVLHILERLREANSLQYLHVLHFHLGSQVGNIIEIQKGLSECARYYIEMRQLGIPIHTVDVGGGLGIDYEGTRSRSECSVNYTVQEYANNIMHTFAELCNEHEIEHPGIITESGRALTAHHALLITNIIDLETPLLLQQLPAPPEQDDPLIIHQLWETCSEFTPEEAQESYHDACHWHQEAHTMFTHGILSLKQKAQAEQYHIAICQQVRNHLHYSIRAHREIIDELNEKLAHKYFANFSLFQSLPDAWAIEQIFPVIPLKGLDHKPTCRAVIQDITCDSDGRIDLYVDSRGVETSLPIAPEVMKRGSLIGIFLVGAYQEILGDMHNLFGDTDSVHVECTADGGYRLEEPLQGDTVEDVLQYVQYSTKDLMQSYRTQCFKAEIDADQAQQYLQELLAGLHGYTYLEE